MLIFKQQYVLDQNFHVLELIQSSLNFCERIASMSETLAQMHGDKLFFTIPYLIISLFNLFLYPFPIIFCFLFLFQFRFNSLQLFNLAYREYLSADNTNIYLLKP